MAGNHPRAHWCINLEEAIFKEWKTLIDGRRTQSSPIFKKVWPKNNTSSYLIVPATDGTTSIDEDEYPGAKHITRVVRTMATPPKNAFKFPGGYVAHGALHRKSDPSDPIIEKSSVVAYEMPHLVSSYAAYEDRGELVLLDVSGHDLKTVEKFEIEYLGDDYRGATKDREKSYIAVLDSARLTPTERENVSRGLREKMDLHSIDRDEVLRLITDLESVETYQETLV